MTPDPLTSAERLAEAERIARFGVWRWHVATGTVEWSDGLHRLFGLEPGEFAGTVEDFLARLHPDDRAPLWAAVSAAVETLEPFAFEERIRRPDGEERRLVSQGRVIADPDGRAVAVVGVCHDVTAQRHAQRELGMSRRRLRAIVDSAPSVIAVKDLSGRYVMANAGAGRLLGVPADDLVGRLCTELFPESVATQLRVNDAVAVAEGRAVYDETVLMVGDEPRTYETVTFALTDDEGRPVEVCTTGTDVTERRERETERRFRAQWRQRIDSALDGDGMVVHGQPIVDLATGATVAHELLVRMRALDDAERLLPPAEFLPACEELGLVQAVDAWVVQRALRFARERRVTVNLSAVTVSDPAARAVVLDTLAEAPEAAHGLVFELTETAAVEQVPVACAFAQRLVALGAEVALDDFGIGFGTFSYLRRLPVHHLKIDRAFVRDLVGSPEDRRVVASIVGIAEQFGVRTIAEGVEDAATLDLLATMGVSCAQGFHLGRPAPLTGARVGGA